MSLLVYGIVVGCLYGFWAAGFSLIYLSTRTFHVVHASVFVLAGYTYWLVEPAYGALIATILSVSAGIILGILAELLIYRPLLRRGATPVLLFVASLGAYIVIENLILLVWGGDTRIVSPPFEAIAKGLVRIGGAGLSVFEIAEAAIGIGLWIGALGMLRFTLVGKAMRAIAASRDLAELAGINVTTIRVTVIGVGSMFIAVAGITTTMRAGIEPSSGLSVWIVAVICTLIGQSDPFQAFFVGLFLGIAEAIILMWISATWQPAVPVIILLLYLTGSAARHLASTLQARRNAQRSMASADLRI